MKYLAHVFLLLVGVGAAFLRWVDLVNFVDAETGFVLVGSVWWRYGALGLLCVLAFAACFMAARRPQSLEGGCAVCGVVLCLAAALCAAYNGTALYAALDPATFFASGLSALAWLNMIAIAEAGIALLGLLCATWLFALAFAQFGKGYRLPAGGVSLGLFGNFYFYAVLIFRFAANQSSYHRLAPTISVFCGAAALWLFTVLLRAVYFPQSRVGRKVYFAGLACFYITIVFALPQAVFDLMVGSDTVAACAEGMLFAAFGLVGAAFATRALGAEKV
ncbi:MAG: hypothetical protein R3Y06_10785 [Faecalibacterium sp.]